MDLDERWLQQRFPAHQVTCGLAVTNQTPHRMSLIDTYLHYGAVDPSFPVPRAVEPGAQTIIVAKNSRSTAGTSGLTLWRLGNTHYHCVLMWSAPRNFYLHANTLAIGITPGKPFIVESGGYEALFNDMYYYDGKVAGVSTYYAKVSCNYGEEVREGSFANGRFQIGARLGQEHRHWATVCVGGVSPIAAEADRSSVRSYEQAKVILVTHSYLSNWRRAAMEEEKCHMALLLLTKKRSVYGGGRIDSIWICELTGREGGKRDVSLRESAVARCEEIGSTASGILHERKSLGIKTYNMGLIQVNTDDLVSRNSICAEGKFRMSFRARFIAGVRGQDDRRRLGRRHGLLRPKHEVDSVPRGEAERRRPRRDSASQGKRGQGGVSGESLGRSVHGCRSRLRRDRFGLGWPDVAVDNGLERETRFHGVRFGGELDRAGGGLRKRGWRGKGAQ